jgi:hypothetical protein
MLVEPDAIEPTTSSTPLLWIEISDRIYPCLEPTKSVVNDRFSAHLFFPVLFLLSIFGGDLVAI